MAESPRYLAIRDALRQRGQCDAQVLLWTQEQRMARLVCHRAGVSMIPLRLDDGWRGWVIVRGDSGRPQCRAALDARRYSVRPETVSATASPLSASRSSRPMVSAITGHTCSGLRCRKRRVARS
jgi:hypothetical protein